MTIIERHVFSKPSPFCGACLGEGIQHIPFDAEDGKRCRCTKWCDRHSMYCEETE